MFSQLRRIAAKAEVPIDDLEMDLRMTYDLTGKFPIENFSDAAQGISYIFKIKSPSPLENVTKVAQAADKGCHTVNPKPTINRCGQAAVLSLSSIDSISFLAMGATEKRKTEYPCGLTRRAG